MPSHLGAQALMLARDSESLTVIPPANDESPSFFSATNSTYDFAFLATLSWEF